MADLVGSLAFLSLMWRKEPTIRLSPRARKQSVSLTFQFPNKKDRLPRGQAALPSHCSWLPYLGFSCFTAPLD